MLQLDTLVVSTKIGNGWLNEVAVENIVLNLVHNGADQLLMFELPPLLNAVAKLNMAPMLVTLDISQVPISWLNAVSCWNIPWVVVDTLDVLSKLVNDWLKLEAK